MPIIYYYDEIKGLVYEKFEGDVHVSDLNELIEKDFKSRDYPEGVKAIFEVKKVNMHFGISDILPMIRLLAKYPDKLNHARWAFLCTEPVLVAYLYYFKQLSKFLPFSVEIFSTMEGCLGWLGMSKDELSALLDRIDESAVVISH